MEEQEDSFPAADNSTLSEYYEKAKVALITAPPGCGKTYEALLVAVKKAGKISISAFMTKQLLIQSRDVLIKHILRDDHEIVELRPIFHETLKPPETLYS